MDDGATSLAVVVNTFVLVEEDWIVSVVVVACVILVDFLLECCVFLREVVL
jgi:hypothetical protein